MISDVSLTTFHTVVRLAAHTENGGNGIYWWKSTLRGSQSEMSPQYIHGDRAEVLGPAPQTSSLSCEVFGSKWKLAARAGNQEHNVHPDKKKCRFDETR